MKTLLGTLFLLLLCGTAFPADGEKGQGDTAFQPVRIRIIQEGGESIVAMLDNPQARAFLSLLPLEIRLDDFSHAEKIFYLSQKLDLQGGENAEGRQGDFCYYAPWGNIAIFYKGMGHGTSLYVLGQIEKGKALLAAHEKSFPARIEVIR